MKNKVVIIGGGNVGMSYAYALLNQKTKADEIILIDIKKDKVEGEAMDLNHGLALSPTKIDIRVGNYSDCYDATIVCICAGANQTKNETRLDLVYKNNLVFKDIIKQVISSGFHGIFLIATNPVDIMTYITYKISKFDKSKVVGTGTTLDTARLRYLIGEELNISFKNVHAYVMGEHGDSEFVPWSNAYISSVKIDNFLSHSILEEIANKVKKSAYEIIEKKGATYYAIGMVLVNITNAILDDENIVLTVSSYNEEHDLFIGMPTIVNKNGVSKTLKIELTEDEKEKFVKSVTIIKQMLKKII
jgi:L-lactate dehydrogenase